MYPIPIDDWNYHANMLTEKEQEWGLAVYERVIRKDADMFAFTEKALSPLMLQKPRRRALLTDIILAFCHTMQTDVPPKTEAQMDKKLKKQFHTYLPYIVENLQAMQSSHLVQYEPIMLSCLYLSRTLREAMQTHILNNEIPEGLVYYQRLEFNNLLRTMNSSLVMLTVGDDVHGAALLRGFFEILAKLTLSERFADEYVLFTKFNEYLQIHRSTGEPFPPEMVDFLKKHHRENKNLDNFLAYGWAKNKAGSRILTTSELMHEAFDERTTYIKWMSLFVHENYVGIAYDYPRMRKMLSAMYFVLFDILFKSEEISPLLAKKERRKARNLIQSTSPLCESILS